MIECIGFCIRNILNFSQNFPLFSYYLSIDSKTITIFNICKFPIILTSRQNLSTKHQGKMHKYLTVTDLLLWNAKFWTINDFIGMSLSIQIISRNRKIWIQLWTIVYEIIDYGHKLFKRINQKHVSNTLNAKLKSKSFCLWYSQIMHSI